MTSPNICVVGFGALGTLYSFALERAGARVTAVCRSNYVTVQEHGVDVQSQKFGVYLAWRPHRVVDSVESAAVAEQSYDYIVCTFKCLPDIQTTPQILGPLLSRTRTFVLIQNGIGIELDLQRAVPDAIVISGCGWTDATIVDHGRTLRHGPLERLVLGAHPFLGTSPKTPPTADAHTALTTLVDLFKSGGGTSEQVHNIDAARWKKMIWNAGFSTFATLGNATLPEICHEPARSYTIPVVRGFMQEVVAVARAQGVDEADLPLSSIDEAVDLTLREYGVGGPAYKPSMLVDFQAERPMEIEVIIGGILRYAHGSSVPTPRLDAAYALLKVHQTKFIEKNKSKAN